MQTRRSAGLAGSVPPAVPASLVPRRGDRPLPTEAAPAGTDPLAAEASSERQQDPPHFAWPRGQPTLGTPRGAVQDAGSAAPFLFSAQQQLRRGAAGDGGSQRGALTWRQAQSPESYSEEEEPHPPGAAAAGLACSREGASEAGMQRRHRALVPLPRRLRCGAAPREQAAEPALPSPAPRSSLAGVER